MFIVQNLPLAEKNLIGMHITEMYPGQAGMQIQDIMDNLGYITNKGKGCDIPELQVEIKCRAVEAVSAHTVAKMSAEDIINTPYYESLVYEKFQQQFRVKFSRGINVITQAKMYNFNIEACQRIAEASYEGARKLFQATGNPKYIKADGCYGYFERTKKDLPDIYDFRFKDNDMKKLESMANTAKRIESMFECHDF